MHEVLRNLFSSTEEVAELKVTSQLAPAEYGQVGDISFVGKGGTNAYHGSLIEYLQNDALDAIPGFANGKPQKRANTVGSSIGGLIRLPHYNGKDRTFFFFDYKGNRQRASSAVTQNVPTQAMLKGDFSALCSSYNPSGVCTDPKGTQLVNPFTGQPYRNNQIPSGQFNRVSENVLSAFYPSANFANANPLETNDNFRINFPVPSRPICSMSALTKIFQASSHSSAASAGKRVRKAVPWDSRFPWITLLIRKLSSSVTVTPSARICSTNFVSGITGKQPSSPTRSFLMAPNSSAISGYNNWGHSRRVLPSPISSLTEPQGSRSGNCGALTLKVLPRRTISEIITSVASSPATILRISCSACLVS